MSNFYREITPLKPDQLFFAKFTKDDPMDFPLHFHEDYELTLVMGVDGNRLVGNQVEHFSEKDLTLIGPDVLHSYRWDPGFPGGDVVVLQFGKESKDWPTFNKGALRPVGEMLQRMESAITFPRETIDRIQEKMLRLPGQRGIQGVFLFMDILHELATSGGELPLSELGGMDDDPIPSGDREKIGRILRFVQKNYGSKISLKDIAAAAQLSPSSVSRYFRQKTGYSLWEYISNYRIDQVARQMLRTDEHISNICYMCGYNNLSNFNRAFKKRMGMTPQAYRKQLRSMR